MSVSRVDSSGAGGTERESETAPGEGGGAAQARDRRAMIAELMDSHGEALYAYCWRLLRDPVLAEDVVQQVFLEAYRDLGRFEQRSSLATWLFGIASHRCQDAIRSRLRHASRVESDDAVLDEVEDPADGAGERVDQARLAAVLEECLSLLPVEARIAVLARFHLGLSYPEMAQVLEVKADTLHTRVARALPVLRRLLRARGVAR